MTTSFINSLLRGTVKSKMQSSTPSLQEESPVQYFETNFTEESLEEERNLKAQNVLNNTVSIFGL